MIWAESCQVTYDTRLILKPLFMGLWFCKKVDKGFFWFSENDSSISKVISQVGSLAKAAISMAPVTSTRINVYFTGPAPQAAGPLATCTAHRCMFGGRSWLGSAALSMYWVSAIMFATFQFGTVSLLNDWLQRERFVYVGWSGLLLSYQQLPLSLLGGSMTSSFTNTTIHIS